MSIYKEYINEFGKIVTSQQASQLEDYNEKIYENDRIKKIIHYWDREIQFITVHIYPDENLNTILNTLTDIDMEYSIAKDFEQVNGYKVWKYYPYQNGILSATNTITEVHDSENRIVAYRFEGDAIVRKVWYLEGKHVYNEEEELDFYYGDEWISFDFENGALKMRITFAPEVGPFSNVDQLRGYNDVQLPFLTEEIITYFTNPEPLVPNVTI